MLNGDKPHLLKKQISDKREEWRKIRSGRLNFKIELLNMGLDVKRIRKEKQYKKLKKEQYRLSKEIKHLEKRLNSFFH